MPIASNFSVMNLMVFVHSGKHQTR